MRNQRLVCASLATLAMIAFLLVSTPAPAAEAESATEDIVYMLDGRELHGQILEETREEIVLQFVDRSSGIESRLRLKQDEIARIDKDVVLTAAVKAVPTDRKPAAAKEDEDKEKEPEKTYGLVRSKEEEHKGAKFYVVPMKGQFGTDVHAQVYEEMIDDIRAQKPDYLIIEMNCLDEEERLYSRIEEEDKGLSGFEFLDDYRDLVNLFHDELGDIPQVVWIKDSYGISSVVAMSWNDLYLTPAARLGGLSDAAANFLWTRNDENKYGKFREAYMGWLKGFVENSGHDLKLVDAMVLTEFTLSASWKGREVTWSLDSNGEYLVDDNDKATVSFPAKSAEDFCISSGTAETLDDLAVLLGVREYYVAEGRADEIFEQYVENWRRTLDNCKVWFDDYRQYLGWATGEDTLKYLSRAKSTLEKVVASMERYRAVEFRIGMELRLSKFTVETWIERLEEQIRAINTARRSGGGGRGGGGSQGGASGG